MFRKDTDLEVQLQQDVRIEEGASAAVLPAGVYEAKLADPHLKFLFARSRHGDNDCDTGPA